MVSKKAIYNLIPQKYYPITELIRRSALEEIKTTIEKLSFSTLFCKTRYWFAGLRSKKN
jgi:hypothetical protein